MLVCVCGVVYCESFGTNVLCKCMYTFMHILSVEKGFRKVISTPLYIYLPSQRELELQRRLSEASDREYANRQENLRLERLAEQLHVQKKALDHREFDLVGTCPTIRW